MDLNINILADQLKEYAEYVGEGEFRDGNGRRRMHVEHYMLDGCTILLQYDVAFEGDLFLKSVEVKKV